MHEGRSPVRRAAVRALQKPVGGRFIILWQHKLDVLRSLPLWMRALFEELVACCDFTTGAGLTSYEALIQRLTPIQPSHGPRHFAPNAHAIRDALVRFSEGFIMIRRTADSQAGQGLFFELAPRMAEVRPQVELRGGTPRGSDRLESKERRGF